jgi:hypothetical protein
MPFLPQVIVILLNHLECPVQLVAPQRATRPSHFDFGLQPDLGIIVIVLRTFAHMHTSPFFIAGIIAMKPEDEVTFLKHLRAHAIFLY